MSIHWGGRGAGHISRWSASTTGVPVLSLDFLSGTLDPRITFTRSSTATFVGSNGLIQNAAINTPRFDYDPVTLAAKGLLIEQQRTNLMIYSEQFNNAIWTKGAATVTANATTAPDGAATADLLTETATSNFHFIFQGATTAAGAATATVYAKLSSGSRNLSIFPQGTTVGWTIFNLATGVITATGGAAFLSSSITAAGNGWYRCSVTWTASAVSSNFVCYMTNSTTAPNPSYLGDGTSGIFLYGAQLEAGAFATSYIPTVASQVIRTADIATMTGTNFSSWYNASEGAFVASYEASPNTFTTYLAASNGVVAQNSMHMDNDGAGNMRVAYYSGSSAVALLSLGAVGTINAVNKIATAYKVNDFAACRNGGTVATDTAGAVPVSVTQLNIGADPSGAATNVTNTHIRSIRYYNTRLLNSQLQTLSQ
jgi:hypothetical protein